MASLAYLPKPTPSVETSAEVSRRERETLTATIFVRLTDCSASERQRLQHQVMLLNLGLADGIAARYTGRGVERDDLIQVARLGLLKSVVGYRADKGTVFAAYASPTIAGEIKRYFRDYVWMVRPPRRLQELHSELRLVEPELRQRLQAAPSAADLASALGVEPKELSEALFAAGGYCTVSLDLPAYAGSGQSLGDALFDDNDDYTMVERTQWLRPALARLTRRQRQIVELRFVEDLSQGQIGRRLGFSQMHVSRLLAGILAQLRDDLKITNFTATA